MSARISEFRVAVGFVVFSQAEGSTGCFLGKVFVWWGREKRKREKVNMHAYIY